MFGRFGGNIFGPELGGDLGGFKQTYRCYPVTMIDTREDVERGGKVLMPPSALEQLIDLHIQYPMMFKLKNYQQNRYTHCGVLEFVADEGRIHIPYWMMRNLLIYYGDPVEVENVSLKVATFTKFQPQSIDFLDITYPEAVLGNILRSFACLTKGDVISIKYNEREYELCVLETKPEDAISIIECDMNDPIDMSEYLDKAFTAFSGSGNRLDGKKKGLDASPEVKNSVPHKRGIPNYKHKKGTITFIRTRRNITDNNEEEEKDFEAFSGSGQMLRKKERK